MTSATATRTRKPRTKAPRSVNLLWPITSCVPGIVQITEAGVRDRYDVLSVPADFGTGYEVKKQGSDAEPYHVLLATDGRNHTCDCLGHLRHGHKTRCRHVGGLLALKAAGKLS